VVGPQALDIHAALLERDLATADPEPTPAHCIITAGDFRAHRTVLWQPEHISALAGPNGSGTLQDIYQRSLSYAVTKLGGATGLRRRDADPGDPVELGIRLGPISWRWKLAVEGASVNPYSEETLSYQDYTWVRRSMGSATWYLRGQPQTADSDGRSCLRMLQDRDNPDALRPLINLLRDLRVHELYDLQTLRSGATMRRDADRLDPSGANLYAVLHTWSAAPQRFDGAYAWVMKKLQRAFPDLISALEFDAPGNSVQARFYPPTAEPRVSGDSGLPIQLAADGLLIGLLHLTAIAGAPRGALIAIDEFENHLHPHAIRHLLAAIRERAEDRDLTVLITTHSPVVMNEFRDEHQHKKCTSYRETKGGAEALRQLAWSKLLDGSDTSRYARAMVRDIADRLDESLPFDVPEYAEATRTSRFSLPSDPVLRNL
jgi:hypothetical protein